MIVRPAIPGDAARASEIVRTSLAGYGLPFDPEGRDADMLTFGQGRGGFEDFVAEVEGDVMGLVSVGPQGEPGAAWLAKLFVDARARRGGLGLALLSRAHDTARARGYRVIRLRTRILFREAIALYEREGYVREPADLASSPDNVIFRRSI